MKLEEKNEQYAENVRRLRADLAKIKSQAEALSETSLHSGDMRHLIVRLWDAYNAAQQILRAKRQRAYRLQQRTMERKARIFCLTDCENNQIRKRLDEIRREK